MLAFNLCTRPKESSLKQSPYHPLHTHSHLTFMATPWDNRNLGFLGGGLSDAWLVWWRNLKEGGWGEGGHEQRILSSHIPP